MNKIESKMKKFVAFIAFILTGAPFIMGQDTATYIENLAVQDSAEIQAQMLGAAEQASGSSSYTSVVLLVVVVVVLLVVFMILRKKRKK